MQKQIWYIYKDIAEDVHNRFDASSYEVDRLLPMGKNKKVIGLMKDALGGQIMKTFAGFRPKIYSYLKDSNDKCKKAKGTKKCVLKRKLKFEYYKKWLKASQIMNIVHYLEKKRINVDCLEEDEKELIKKG